jgi:voltage-gated potassium channel
VSHRRRALLVIGWAVLLDAALGMLFALAQGISYWSGLWFATVTATTVGYGDIIPHGWLAHVTAVLMMLTVIPLFASAFSLLTSGLTSTHVAASEARIKEHVEERLLHHFSGGERM